MVKNLPKVRTGGSEFFFYLISAPWTVYASACIVQVSNSSFDGYLLSYVTTVNRRSFLLAQLLTWLVS